MSSKIHIADRKPMMLDLKIGKYFWCRCGRSAEKSFCDGSHAGTDITPLEFEMKENKKVAICLCKHTKNQPFCDGTHLRLPK